jgi:hypothetical protein
VTFVVDADIQYARGHISGTEKLSNVLSQKDLRTFTIKGTIRNVTGGRADIGQSEAPAAGCANEEVTIDKK